MLFFQLMTRRYEHASTVLTLNKGFEEWGEIFGDEVMAAALIDRLVHHCHLVTIRGNSSRMRQHTELGRPCTRRRIPSLPTHVAAAPVRRPRRSEARPLVDLSDFHPAELSDFRPALTLARCKPSMVLRCRVRLNVYLMGAVRGPSLVSRTKMASSFADSVLLALRLIEWVAPGASDQLSPAR